MSGLLSPVLGVLKAIPWWAYALVAALAWGAYNRHDARSQAAAKHALIQVAAAEEAKALRASIAESERRVAAHQEIASAAQARIVELERSAAAVRTVAGRVRPAAVAYVASAAASNPAATAECKATEATAGVLAELLGRATERASLLADLANRTHGAGQACEAFYDKLTR